MKGMYELKGRLGKTEMVQKETEQECEWIKI